MGQRILFMGSPDFAIPSLRALARSWDVVGVVTQPDRQAGRGRKLKCSDVKVFAQNLGLSIFQPASLREPDAVNYIRSLSPDLIVVAAFGQILKQAILSIPLFGCVNVHASLLPRWRGAAPIQAAILNDEITGVTIMKMDRGLDTGPMLAQRSLLIPPHFTSGDLSNRLAEMGAELLVETLPQYFEGDIKPRAQNEAEATVAPRLVKADGELDFNQSAEYLARQIRAYNPWPGAYSFFNGTQIKVFQAHAISEKTATPGKRYEVDHLPAWGTYTGLLVLDEVQAAGKKRMSGMDFLRGTQNWIEKQEE